MVEVIYVYMLRREYNKLYAEHVKLGAEFKQKETEWQLKK